MSERLGQLQAELHTTTEEAEAARVDALRIAADLRNARIEDPDHVTALESALTDANSRTELADERSAAVREQLLALAELVADPVSGLDGEHPIALLPVRIETRFEHMTEPRQLLVRIYPDEVHVDSHEPQLTDAELDSARRYWERMWRAGTRNVDAERAAFVELARAVGTPRAAWVARVTTPDPTDRPPTPTPDDQPLASPPVLPTVERSPELLTRPAQAKMLPDRWTVIGFRGGAEVVRVSGAVVPERLQVGPSPDAEHTPDGVALEEGLRWLVDFDLAERNGMGIRVPLEDERGFDRLLVLGVKASLDPTASAARLAQLLNVHRFTTGLGFVRSGTPTNNTDSAEAGWAALPNAEELFALEHERAGDARSNATRTGAAFGLPARTLQRLEHARDADEDDARQMRVALWPATLGYFLETLMAPGLGDPDLAVVRDQFVNYVRGLGPLPTLRIGSQPYGLLPVTSLARWQPDPGDNIRHVKIVRLLRQLAAEWLARTRAPAPDGVPHVGRPGTTPDQELLTILAREALSLSYRIRSVRGPVFAAAARPLMSGLDRAGPDLADATFALFDRPTLQARVRRCEFDPRTATLGRPLVQHDPLSESDPVPPADESGPNYLRWLGERGDRTGEPFPTDADTILFQLLQHSATLADADAAVGISQPDSVLALKSALEPEIIDPGSTPTPTLRRLLADPASQVSAGTISSNAPIGDFLATATRPQIVALNQRHILNAFDRTSAVRAAMAALATRPSAVVDRLAREVLDSCSHRLDAWITSYATRRLSILRKANATGMHLGGYAWVEDLQPKAPPTPVGAPPPEETGPLVEDPTNAGFLHGPSLAHAAAAAVLRSAHLSHTQAGAKDGPLAIDLSSDRVRTALWLIDGIRQGQPLGALLGYRFERGLHDRSHPGLELDQFIRRFRALDPLVAGRNEPVAQTIEAVEAVAPTNVVDGLALVQRFTARPTSIDPALDGATELQRDAVKAELAALVDAVDAVADLLLAESTYQLINGNTTRAAASIDSLGSGLAPPPELEVATTPRQGYAYTYRVLTLLPPSNQPADGWDGGAKRPRRLAEPRLERWAAAFLGPATHIRTAARLSPPDNEPSIIREVTLSAAGLCALDLVYDSQGAAGTSAVEAWLRRHLAANPGSGVAAGAHVELLHVGDDGWPGDSWPPDVLPLDDALELAAALANVLGASRPATAKDVAATNTTSTGTDDAELAARAEAIAAQFGSDADDLQARLAEAKASPTRLTIGRLRSALAALAGYGLATTQEALRAETGPQVNDPDAGGRTLLAVADLVAAEVTTISELSTAADATATERIQAIFGSQFTVTPLFVSTAQAELGAAIAAGARPDFLGRDRSAPLAWLQRVGRTRERTARLTLALLYGHTPASGHRLDVAQLPEARRWVALPFNATGPPAAATSLVVHSHAPVNMDEPLAGLLVDEWVEFVPRRSVTTGIATHIDEPGARAPQTLLLAVPPNPGEQWSLDGLIAVINEAADLARIRTVAPDEVPWIGRIAPGLYFADNRRDDTLRLDFQRLTGKAP